MRFADFPISRRIHLITVAATLGLLALLAVNVLDVGSAKREDIAIKTRHVVETAHGVLAHFEAEARAGRMTTVQAQQAAMNTVKAMRYEGAEYFWINDMQPRMVMHPFRPELDGKDLSENKDPAGKRLFVAFVETVRKDGAGFVDYLWPKPGAREPVPKISYVKGFAPWGWIIGSGVYVDEVDGAIRGELMKAGPISGLVLLAVIGAGILIARSIVRPITSIVGAMDRVAAGEHDLQITGMARMDEVGTLAKALDVFRMQGREATRLAVAATAENAARERRQRAMEGFTSDFSSSVSGVLQTLSDSATKMKTASRTMIDTASSTRGQMMDVQKTSETSAGNLANVAAASEEMLSSIGEIRRQIDRAAEVTTQAVTATRRSSDLVDGLATSAQQIGDVVKLINAIAGQTNLLALNATIEAARAGEAGRGFAVVANEVKGLAAQTARATTDIAERIQRVQESTSAATGAIRDVTDVVGKVDEIARAIAGAMDQQSLATQEIVQNVQLASRSTQSAAAGVTHVFGAADMTTSAANDVMRAADDVAAQADDLHGEVDTFLTAMTRAGDRREFERHPCRIPADVSIGGGKSEPVTLLDISRSGAQIDRALTAPVGGTLELLLDGATSPVTVRVARKGDRNTGITFRQDEATTRIISSVLDKAMREVSVPRVA